MYAVSSWWQAQRNSMRIMAPHSGGVTSAVAARSMDDHTAGLRGTILALLVEQGPLTSQEIEDRTGLEGNTVRPRLVELRAFGRVRDSGRTRLTRSGREAVLWESLDADPGD